LTFSSLWYLTIILIVLNDNNGCTKQVNCKDILTKDLISKPKILFVSMSLCYIFKVFGYWVPNFIRDSLAYIFTYKYFDYIQQQKNYTICLLQSIVLIYSTITISVWSWNSNHLTIHCRITINNIRGTTNNIITIEINMSCSFQTTLETYAILMIVQD